MDAASGSVAWNAVSNAATCGRSGSAARTAEIAASDRGWWSGASGDSASMAAMAASSSTTGATNRVPPWTTRCPTAAGAAHPAIGVRDDRGVGALDRRQVRRLEDGVVRAEQAELAAARPRVDDEDQPCGVGHAQFAISGASSPSSRV